jgi:hypothetical protein
MTHKMTARFQPSNLGSDEDLDEDLVDDDDVLDDSDGDASVRSNSSDSVDDLSSDEGGPEDDLRMDIEYLVEREELNNIDQTDEQEDVLHWDVAEVRREHAALRAHGQNNEWGESRNWGDECYMSSVRRQGSIASAEARRSHDDVMAQTGTSDVSMQVEGAAAAGGAAGVRVFIEEETTPIHTVQAKTVDEPRLCSHCEAKLMGKSRGISITSKTRAGNRDWSRFHGMLLCSNCYNRVIETGQIEGLRKRKSAHGEGQDSALRRGDKGKQRVRLPDPEDASTAAAVALCGGLC